MRTGIYGQRLTLMEELKAATCLAHAQLQTTPFVVALTGCQLPLESYVGQLRALTAMHGVLEAALAASSHPALATVWNEGMRKLPLLERDLKFFAPRGVADIKEAVEATLALVGSLRLWSVETPLALLGCCYVLEGSTLGGAILRRQYARAFLLEGESGLAYLASYGPQVLERWGQFQRRMNSVSLSDTERKQLMTAAAATFQGLETIFRALYPFRPESKTFLVSSINPEAGRHPVPTDPRAAEAALKAADRCWQAFPYFEMRYGERGLRFARSDGAWLATLGQYEPDQIREQVRWLGRVLAARGMPTLLLEIQLDMLHEELVRACPEKHTEHERLRAVAAELRAARQARLDQTALCRLADDFDRAVGPAWSQRLPNIGRLLGAAVADELNGYSNAIESLQSWLRDESRFPAEWIAAVGTLVVEAQKLATT